MLAALNFVYLRRMSSVIFRPKFLYRIHPALHDIVLINLLKLIIANPCRNMFITLRAAKKKCNVYSAVLLFSRFVFYYCVVDSYLCLRLITVITSTAIGNFCCHFAYLFVISVHYHLLYSATPPPWFLALITTSCISVTSVLFLTVVSGHLRQYRFLIKW